MKWKTGKEKLPTMIIWMPKDVNLTNPIKQTIEYLKKERHVRVAERTPHAWKIQELMMARGFKETVAKKVMTKLSNTKGPTRQRAVTKAGHLIDHPGTDDW